MGYYTQNDRFSPEGCPAPQLAHESDSGAKPLEATSLSLAKPRKLSPLGFSIYPPGVVFSPPSPIDQRPQIRELLSNRYRTAYCLRSWYWNCFSGFATRLGHLFRHSIRSIRIAYERSFISDFQFRQLFIHTTSDSSTSAFLLRVCYFGSFLRLCMFLRFDICFSLLH